MNILQILLVEKKQNKTFVSVDNVTCPKSVSFLMSLQGNCIQEIKEQKTEGHKDSYFPTQLQMPPIWFATSLFYEKTQSIKWQSGEFYQVLGVQVQFDTYWTEIYLKDAF